LAWEDYYSFYLTFGALFAFWEADFHTVKGREALSRPHNDLITTDDNVGVTESRQLSCVMCAWDFKNFDNSFGIYLFLVVLGFEFGASCLLGRHSSTQATPPALFCVGFFRDRVLSTICLGWS
jgi:hypothetical protein